MKWIKRIVHKWVMDTEKEQRNVPGISEAKVRAADEPGEDLQPNLRMNIINAIGGKIVRFVGNYDHQKDRRIDTLYIITDEEDFNESLAKIITMESMKT